MIGEIEDQNCQTCETSETGINLVWLVPLKTIET